MDFFNSQDQARRRTSLLVGFFVLAVAGIILAIYGAVYGLLFIGEVPPETIDPSHLFLWVAGLTVAVVGLGTAWQIVALRSGGEAVARMLGGQRISPDTPLPAERRVLNVVEEMAIASGIPVPPVYLLREAGINAFAAGYTPSDAVIGVTQGCIEKLSRDELQGVIAHEFSHIFNGDMRLNIRLIGVLHGILIIAIIGYMLMRTARVSSRGSKKGGNPLPLLGLALMIIGYIGVFFGKLIKSAVSRQREFLADAAAVQFTRNPGGIAGALRKIAGLNAGSRLAHPQAEEASHLFFSNALRRGVIGWMATHPPLEERIRRLDPQAVTRRAGSAAAAATDATAATPALAGAAAAGFAPGSGRATPPPLPTGASALASIGNPQAEHVVFAATLLAAIPDPLRDAVHTPSGAQAVIYTLLLSADTATREIQLQALADDAPAREQVTALEPVLRSLPRAARLPLVDLAIPTLKTLTPEAYRGFETRVQAFCEADREIDLFEYTLQHALTRHLAPAFGHGRADRPPSASLTDLIDPAVDLLSTLAYYGHDQAADATRSYEAGFDRLGIRPIRPMRPLEACNLALADQALRRMAEAFPNVKKRLLEACTVTIAMDGAITDEEGELIRAIADALGCPMPPLLTGG